MLFRWYFSKYKIKFMARDFKYCLKNEHKCIFIRFKNSRRIQEFLHLIIHDYEFFERLQNHWYRSTYISVALIFRLWGYFGLNKKLDVKFSRVFIRYRHSLNIKRIVFLLSFWSFLGKFSIVIIIISLIRWLILRQRRQPNVTDQRINKCCL